MWAKTSPVFWVSPAESCLWDCDDGEGGLEAWGLASKDAKSGLLSCKACDSLTHLVISKEREQCTGKVRTGNTFFCQIQDRVGLGKEMCFLFLGDDGRALLHSKRTDLKEWQEQRSKQCLLLKHLKRQDDDSHDGSDDNDDGWYPVLNNGYVSKHCAV